ncbi:MAG: hypothetical protein K1X78_27335 [Verrucomicrobiaceae bacterium]|nr:hypothetical protein [Verrucomicrobiaceae bacterium]
MAAAGLVAVVVIFARRWRSLLSIYRNAQQLVELGISHAAATELSKESTLRLIDHTAGCVRALERQISTLVMLLGFGFTAAFMQFLVLGVFSWIIWPIAGGSIFLLVSYGLLAHVGTDLDHLLFKCLAKDVTDKAHFSVKLDPEK